MQVSNLIAGRPESASAGVSESEEVRDWETSCVSNRGVMKKLTLKTDSFFKESTLQVLLQMLGFSIVSLPLLILAKTPTTSTPQFPLVQIAREGRNDY